MTLQVTAAEHLDHDQKQEQNQLEALQLEKTINRQSLSKLLDFDTKSVTKSVCKSVAYNERKARGQVAEELKFLGTNNV